MHCAGARSPARARVRRRARAWGRECSHENRRAATCLVGVCCSCSCRALSYAAAASPVARSCAAAHAAGSSEELLFFAFRRGERGESGIYSSDARDARPERASFLSSCEGAMRRLPLQCLQPERGLPPGAGECTNWVAVQEYQQLVDSLDAGVAANSSNISGIAIWQYADVKVDQPKNSTNRPGGINNKGVLTQERLPKPAAAAVRQAFTHPQPN